MQNHVRIEGDLYQIHRPHLRPHVLSLTRLSNEVQHRNLGRRFMLETPQHRGRAYQEALPDSTYCQNERAPPTEKTESLSDRAHHP